MCMDEREESFEESTGPEEPLGNATGAAPESDADKEGDKDGDIYLKTIEDLRRERDEYYDLLLRKQAEFENYRKRVTREREDMRLAAQAGVLEQTLPVLDSCEKGLEVMDEAGGGPEMAVYREGYELLLRGLRSLLERFHVEEVPSRGESFDPNIHEAVQRQVSEDREDGEVLQVYRKGYWMKGRLLRPAQVSVSVKPQEEPSER